MKYKINQHARGAHLTQNKKQIVRQNNKKYIYYIKVTYNVVGRHGLIKGDGCSGLEKI